MTIIRTHRLLSLNVFMVGTLFGIVSTTQSSIAAETKQKITITGASTIAPVMSEIGKRFEKKYKNVRIDVQTGGSSRGVADVRQGLSDIGMASRSLKDEEKSLHGVTLAMDGICILVHKENSIAVLSNEQIANIFTGKVRNWKDIGGSDSPITVMNRAEGRSELELFSHYLKIKPVEIKADLIVGENAQGIKSLATNKQGVVYMSVGSAIYDATRGVPIKLLPLNGVEATIENVRSGKFPMARPLTLITKEAPKGFVKEFLDFALSPEVHDILKAQFFVPA